MKLGLKDPLRRWLLLFSKVAVLGVALAIVAALSTYFTVRRSISGRDVQVPDLTEMTVEEASAALQERGLILEEAAERNDVRVEAGRVLAQDPPPGTDIKVQRKIKVVVSLGDKVNLVPELRGGAARKAQITLQQQGIRVGGQVYVHSTRVDENLVIGQDPMPGSAGLREGKVSLLVSRGGPARRFVMPDLIGRPEGEVLSFLSSKGLRAAPVRRDPGAPGSPGTVARQDPAAGYPVGLGDLITLTVVQ